MPVVFTDFLDSKSLEFREHASRAHLLVVTSLFDAQGLVVLEVLAMGRPVVASDVGGIGTMLTRNVGRLVPPSDGTALARVIWELHDDPSTTLAMGRCAREHVVRNSSWRACAEAYGNAIQRAVTAT